MVARCKELLSFFTSSFGTYRGPHGISIATRAPAGFAGPSYRPLAPERAWLELPRHEFEARYRIKLAQLSASYVVDELMELATQPALLCWEPAPDIRAGKSWCHRHMVAAWLEGELGIIVLELD